MGYDKQDMREWGAGGSAVDKYEKEPCIYFVLIRIFLCYTTYKYRIQMTEHISALVHKCQ